jgi:DNA-binding MarR family transcriptional regulator
MSKEVSERADFRMTLHIRGHCLCLHTQRAARAIARRFDEAMKPLGLRSGQFSLLMSLNRPEPPTLGSISNLLGMDRTTLTANLKPLKRRDLITVRPDEKDRRARRLSLTPAGLDLLEKAVPIWEDTHGKIEASFERNTDALRQDLDALGKAAFE